eukprot:CAMPEP_0185614434 /NCGR_PEP_ID=MMETSP0436-20130131/31594_1 /TAXON_ID=626734 ORGANISM="Favella taraikaensis, Strain Fe Narragansett Bay" /NCGR_SAMPLE_ID=MMETSP0436 /ASSEMBLY_ACC=CAM_ASM_000390 /LENGTH=69 /DNA_ID=CAMNT_0028249247 /DNA_START=1 /DNA_END=210 /DNA_ORIENTATION=+
MNCSFCSPFDLASLMLPLLDEVAEADDYGDEDNEGDNRVQPATAALPLIFLPAIQANMFIFVALVASAT